MNDEKGKKNGQKILLVRLSSLGDLVQTFPAASVLRENYPQARLDWVVEEKYRPLIQANRNVDEVIGVPRDSWGKLFKQGRLARLFAEVRGFRKELRNKNYDLAFDFHNILRSGFITSFSGAETRWGYGSREGNGFFINHRFPYSWNKEVHAVDQHLLALESIGLKGEEVDFGFKDLPLPPDFPGEEPFVLIHPRTRWNTKNWPISRYVEVGKKFASLGFSVFFSGSKDDGVFIEGELKNIKGLQSLAGKYSLGEFVAIAQKASLFVGGDTGPMHVAVAAGTPVIMIMGPTSEKRFGPYRRESSVAKAQLDCLGCGKRNCAQPICMEQVTVEMVWDAAREKLGIDP